MFAITVPNEKSELAVSGFIVAFIRPHRHRHKPRLLVCGNVAGQGIRTLLS